MKTLITNYSFNAAIKRITFNSVVPPNRESLLLITNVSSGIIIYNFADPNLGGTLSGNELTLSYNTASMFDTDKLQIFVDLPNPAFEDMNETLRATGAEIIRLLQAIRNDGGMADPAGRVRTAIETSATVPISITANQDIRNVTNAAQIGGYAMQQLHMALVNAGAQNLRSKISIS